MASFPRKFSEKIALLNQKAAEGNANYYSIISQVKQIKPNGSQLDVFDSLNDRSNQKAHLNSNNDESKGGSNEQISTTYISDQHRQQVLNHFQNKKPSQNLHPQTQTTSTTSNNSFLQLPGQTDTFRRAHSDSSIPLSVTTTYHQSNDIQIPQNSVYNNDQYNINPGQAQFQQYQSLSNSSSYQQSQDLLGLSCQLSPTVRSPSFDFNNNSLNLSDKNLAKSDGGHLMRETKKGSIRSLGAPVSPTYSPQKGITNGLNLLGRVNDYSNLTNNSFSNEPLSPNSIQLNNSFSPQHSNFSHQSQLSSLCSSHISSSLQQNFDYCNSNFSQQQSHYQPTQTQQLNAYLSQPQQQHLHQSQQQSVNPNFNINTTNNLANEPITCNNNNGNFLNVNIQCTGGSLPDLTSFQFNQNYSQQSIQTHEYQNHGNTPKIRNHSQTHHGQNQHQYEQLLQPNFQQHNHIGPIKLDSSVSPTRGSARYSPTNLGQRRPSPQHLTINRQSLSADPSSAQSTPATPYVSSPNSPLHPSIFSLPSLEFTINSQQITTMKAQASKYSNPLVTGLTSNESLPASPQSQQSCCSPQGGSSPDPLISPKEVQQFNPSNNYDQMNSKFNQINLENNNHQQIMQQQGYYNMMSSPIQQISGYHYETGVEGCSVENQSTINSRSGSLSSSSSVNNNFMDDESQLQQHNQSGSLQVNDLSSSYVDVNLQYRCETINNLQNSIPDIIFTFSSDTPEDTTIIKNELKEPSLIYNENFLIKNGQYEYDLQMPAGTGDQMCNQNSILDNNLENILNNSHTRLYQQT